MTHRHIPPKPINHHKRIKHHSHTHTDADVTSTTVTHSHTANLPTKVCGAACTTYTHYHLKDLVAGNSHSHTVTVSFGSANLGSPNWYEHTHPISVSVGSGGASHNHTISGSTTARKCADPFDEATHSHGVGTPTIGSGGASHTHTITGKSTGNADPSGTPENHVHPFSVALDFGDSHLHSLSGTTASASCYLGCAHTHDYPANSGTTTHYHGISGNSGSGGESPSAVGSLLIQVI